MVSDIYILGMLEKYIDKKYINYKDGIKIISKSIDGVSHKKTKYNKIFQTKAPKRGPGGNSTNNNNNTNMLTSKNNSSSISNGNISNQNNSATQSKRNHYHQTHLTSKFKGMFQQKKGFFHPTSSTKFNTSLKSIRNKDPGFYDPFWDDVRTAMELRINTNLLKSRERRKISSIVDSFQHISKVNFMKNERIIFDVLDKEDDWEACNKKLDAMNQMYDHEKLAKEYSRIVKHQVIKASQTASDSAQMSKQEEVLGQVYFDFNQISPSMQRIFRKRSNAVGRENRRKLFGTCSNQILIGNSSQELSEIYEIKNRKLKQRSISTPLDRKKLWEKLISGRSSSNRYSEKSLWEKLEKAHAPKNKSFQALFQSKRAHMLDVRDSLTYNQQNYYENYMKDRALHKKLYFRASTKIQRPGGHGQDSQNGGSENMGEMGSQDGKDDVEWLKEVMRYEAAILKSKNELKNLETDKGGSKKQGDKSHQKSKVGKTEGSNEGSGSKGFFMRVNKKGDNLPALQKESVQSSKSGLKAGARQSHGGSSPRRTGGRDSLEAILEKNVVPKGRGKSGNERSRSRRFRVRRGRIKPPAGKLNSRSYNLDVMDWKAKAPGRSYLEVK